jgi:alpha-1,2-mannosyltransferase
MYNTKAGGDELYGIEPFSYYVKNLFLNLNYIAAVGILAGVFAPFIRTTAPKTDTWILLLPVYIWLAVVAPRPHKEERFLYPIYPCICLGASILSVWIVEGIVTYTTSRKKPQTSTRYGSILFLNTIVWGPAILLSIARTTALVKYYSAPLSIYADLPQAIIMEEGSDEPAVICTCGEWYRFPSSFYIPNKSSSFGFAPSTFGGQLPQLFTVAGSGPSSLLSDDSPNQFNDMNQPEPGSYTPLHTCDYLVELDSSVLSCTEQLDGFTWEPIISSPFLDASATSSIHRIIYIPRLHEKGIKQGKIRYDNFVLYSKTKIDTLDPN